MKAKILSSLDDQCAGHAAGILKSSGIVVYPTETLYGIGSLADNGSAINRIFNIKKRGSGKPLLTLAKDVDMIKRYFKINNVHIQLYEKFVGLPLTIVLEQRFKFPDELSAGTGKVGVRVSSNQFVGRLFEFIDVPVTSTSANISGQEQPVTIEEIIDQFVDKVDLIVDSGNLPASKGSTILDMTVYPPVILREGDLHERELKEFFVGNSQGL